MHGCSFSTEKLIRLIPLIDPQMSDSIGDIDHILSALFTLHEKCYDAER